jgi:hypothetical protein
MAHDCESSRLCSGAQALEAAFGALEAAVGTMPWALSDNFVSALREGRGRLALSGPGDPTARGFGFSYMRDERKARIHTPAHFSDCPYIPDRSPQRLSRAHSCATKPACIMFC